MSDFLFAIPTFISGMGSVLDLGGTMTIFNESSNPEEADILALANDWSMVGQDLRYAMMQFATA